jgi:hypothetical protein
MDEISSEIQDEHATYRTVINWPCISGDASVPRLADFPGYNYLQGDLSQFLFIVSWRDSGIAGFTISNLRDSSRFGRRICSPL